MRLLFTVLLLFTTALTQARSRDTMVLAFNDELIATTPDMAEFSGYAVQNGNLWAAVIYDGSMRVIARGSYATRRCKSREGWFTFYFPDGKRAGSGQYRQDKKYGVWRFWYPSGALRDSLHYEKDKPHGYYYSYFESGKLSGSGKYNEGIEDSTWTWFHPNGMVSSVEEFYKGKLEGQRCTDSLGRKQLKNCELYQEPMTTENKTIWQLVFEGREMPKDATGKPLSGVVNIQVNITDKGEVKKLEVLPSQHPVLEELVRASLSSKQWQAARNHNRPVPYIRRVSIPFGSHVLNYSPGRPPRLGGDRDPSRDPKAPPYAWNVDNEGYIRE